MTDLPRLQYAPFEPTTALWIGPHNVLEYRNLVLNDRTKTECYWVEEFNGFDSADLLVNAQANVQEDGELPDPGFYGGRTMSMSGYVQAGSYPKLVTMCRAFLDTFTGLVETPLLVTTQGLGLGYFQMPDVTISCRPVDKPSIATAVQPGDIAGLLKRQFSVSLRASTDPFYKATAVKHATLVPQVVRELARVYPRTYDLAYTTRIDSGGHPVAAVGNNITLQNDGNWKSYPIIRFNGGQSGLWLTNDDTDQLVKVNFPIVAGDYIEIDTKTGDILDSGGSNRARQIDSISDWMWLLGDRPVDGTDGANNIALEVNSFDNDASVEFFWSDTFV